MLLCVPYVLSPLFPYLSRSIPYPHTIIWSTRCTPLNTPRVSCKPIPVFTPSTSCYNCTWSWGCYSAVPPYLAQYLQFVRFFFFYFSSHPLILRLCALQVVVIFPLGGEGGGDRDVDAEGDRRLCYIYFSFCFRRPLLGAVLSLFEVVAAWTLSSSFFY